MPTPLTGGQEISFAPQMIFLWPPARGVGKKGLFFIIITNIDPPGTKMTPCHLSKGRRKGRIIRSFKVKFAWLCFVLFSKVFFSTGTLFWDFLVLLNLRPLNLNKVALACWCRSEGKKEMFVFIIILFSELPIQYPLQINELL